LWRTAAGYDAVTAKDVPQGTTKGGDVGRLKVALVHGQSGIRTFEDRCGQMSAPINIGTFKNEVIKCALHAAVLDAETGLVRGEPQMQIRGFEKPPQEMVEAFSHARQIMAQIRCDLLRPVPVAVENDRVMDYA
jgi:nitrite reductase/ring-hydroxylating ferredoxin subunit